MAKRSATELFEHNYTALVLSLPMKDADFIDELLKHDLVPGDLKIRLESLTVLNERSSYFLDNVIKPGLAVGNSRCLDSLLIVMKCNKHENVQDLAKKIEKELAIDIKWIKSILISPRSQWEEYICPDCNELMNDPVMTSCGHRLCCECFDKRISSCGDLWCPVKDDNSQEHKMSRDDWSKDRIAEWKINKLLVKCDECKVECTIKRYKKFDCSTTHEGTNSMLISPRSQWEEYICPDCDILIDDPVLTSCSHLICLECFQKKRWSNNPWCSVRDDDGQEHKMSQRHWSQDRTAEWNISKLLVKCEKCNMECTMKQVKKFDCSTAHEAGIKSLLISPRSQWEKYICPNCDKLINDPVLTSCKHQMCFKCFEKRKKIPGSWCPVRDDTGQEHKMSRHDWSRDRIAMWKINKLLVVCEKCKIECTMKNYRSKKMDCSTAHDKGINSILISLRSKWKEYVCPDCDQLMDDPILTSCGHQMCYKCFDIRKDKKWSHDSWCPVRDNDGQEHKMSQYGWRWDRTAEQEINKYLVKCEKCAVECTVKKYRKFGCSVGHEGINSILISPRSQWEEYICPYCDELMDDPILTSCGHQMCYKCFNKRKSSRGDLWCPCRDDDGQEHKMSSDGWRRDKTTEEEINKLLVQCKKCNWVRTIKKYRQFDCLTAHEGIKSILISPRSQWEEYICPDCDELIHGLVLTSCGHQICYKCFDNRKNSASSSDDLWCPVRNDDGQEHKMSWDDWSRNKTADWKISKLQVKCKKCRVTCTVKRYESFSCSTAHEGSASWERLLSSVQQ